MPVSASCDDGVVIDLSGMNRVEVDAGKQVARAQAGALVRDLDQATQLFGLATTSGGSAIPSLRDRSRFSHSFSPGT